MFKFGTVVTPDQYFSTVGTIPREKDELRGVLSKHPKNAEESLADALAQVKPSLNDSTHSARLNHSSETANGVEVPNGEPVKRRRGRAPKKPTPYDEEFEEEDRKPKALDKPKKATASVSSKVASPEKKEGRGRGRRGGKAGNKAGEKHRDKNQINSEKMSSTANHVDEEVDFSQPEKAAASLRHLNKRIGGGLHGNIEKIKNDPTESCVNDSSSTASGVHSKRKLSFEDEIFDHMDDAIEKILERRALSVTPLGGSSREITQKIKSIRLEPRDTDAPPICKKLKQTEKKVKTRIIFIGLVSPAAKCSSRRAGYD